MAEHDYAIANDTAAQVRADINLALAAIVSQNSKATAPSTTFANMIWYDTANNILKMRNEDDDAWISLFELDQSGDLVADLTITDLTVSTSLTNTLLRTRPGYIENLGMSYASNTLTFNGYDGTALSASNPAYVCAPSRTAGQHKLYTLTANQGFIDSTGASEISGALFGFTTSIAITVDVPYFAYFCVNDAESTGTIGVSRIPNLNVAPAAGLIGKAGTPAAASTEMSLFLIENVTVGDYDGNPVMPLGSFRMRMDGSDDHAVQALNDTDGIGQFQESVIFAMPISQNGAASGKYFIDNGGTAPGFSAGAMEYTISRNGFCKVYFDFQGSGSNGSGAVTAYMVVPLQWEDTDSSIGERDFGSAMAYINGTNTTASFYAYTGASTKRALAQMRHDNGALLTNAAWTGGKVWRGEVNYPIANS